MKTFKAIFIFLSMAIALPSYAFCENVGDLNYGDTQIIICPDEETAKLFMEVALSKVQGGDKDVQRLLVEMLLLNGKVEMGGKTLILKIK